MVEQAKQDCEKEIAEIDHEQTNSNEASNVNDNINDNTDTNSNENTADYKDFVSYMSNQMLNSDANNTNENSADANTGNASDPLAHMLGVNNDNENSADANTGNASDLFSFAMDDNNKSETNTNNASDPLALMLDGNNEKENSFGTSLLSSLSTNDNSDHDMEIIPIHENNTTSNVTEMLNVGTTATKTKPDKNKTDGRKISILRGTKQKPRKRKKNDGRTNENNIQIDALAMTMKKNGKSY